jgi:hypothetical protein
MFSCLIFASMYARSAGGHKGYVQKSLLGKNQTARRENRKINYNSPSSTRKTLARKIAKNRVQNRMPSAPGSVAFATGSDPKMTARLAGEVHYRWKKHAEKCRVKKYHAEPTVGTACPA